MSVSATRVLVLHNMVAPYRLPLFRALAKEPGVDLSVWFMSRAARNRRWSTGTQADLGFRYRVLPSLQLGYFREDLFTYIVNYTFPMEYVANDFDVLIAGGWLDFACQVGFALSKVLRRKFLLWTESTAFEGSWRRGLTRPLVQAMCTGSDLCIAGGTRARDYLRSLRVPDASIVTAFSTVDVQWFRGQSSHWRTQREQLRAGFAIQGRPVILYCGQLIRRKGVDVLLDAFARVQAQVSDAALVLVGYGPEQARLASHVAEARLANVHFVDNARSADMPRLYSLADIFVLPSLEEAWGLVVNEAMACGLPVVVSSRVGAAVDLVKDGENGYVVTAGRADELAERVLELSRDADLRARFGSCSAERIERFTPERAARVFASAVREVERSK